MNIDLLFKDYHIAYLNRTKFENYISTLSEDELKKDKELIIIKFLNDKSSDNKSNDDDINYDNLSIELKNEINNFYKRINNVDSKTPLFWIMLSITKKKKLFK